MSIFKAIFKVQSNLYIQNNSQKLISMDTIFSYPKKRNIQSTIFSPQNGNYNGQDPTPYSVNVVPDDGYIIFETDRKTIYIDPNYSYPECSQNISSSSSSSLSGSSSSSNSLSSSSSSN